MDIFFGQEKKYIFLSFVKINLQFGYKISVFQESINQYIFEYLMNFNYFVRDGKHLSVAGKAIFARNLAHCIHNVLGGKVNGYNNKW